MAIRFPILRSIRARLFALALGVALPLVALIAFDHTARLAARVEIAGESARELASAVAASLTQLIEAERTMLAVLAARPFQRVMRPPVCDPLLAEIKALNPYRANITVTTAAGETVCSAVPFPPAGPISVAGQDYAQRLLRTGEFSTGEPFKGFITGRWVAPLAYPRRDAADRLIGWVGVPLDVERIGDLLARGRGENNDVILVVSPQGRVVSRSADVARWVGTDVREQPFVSALLGGTRSVSWGVGIDGVARIWGAADVPLAGWKVIVGLDEARLLAPANAALLRNSLLIAVILLLAAVLAFGIGRAIAAPIHALAQTVGRIAAGERGLRSPLTGASEIARIAAELNRMLDALDRSEAESARAAAALREREETLRLVTETIDEVFWMIDIGSGSMLYISSGYERVWGRTNPRSFLDAVHPEDLDRLLDTLKLMQTGQPFEAEYRIVRPDASIRWIWSHCYPVRDASGKATRYAGVAQDITERKHAEESLGESRARLEALTRRLLEVQETERRSIARELHDEIGGVLTAVKLNLQALRREHMAGQGEAALADGLALVDGAIHSVRSLSLDLRPAMLDDLGLIPALKWYCERQARRAGVAIDLALDAIDLKASPQLESACYRIVQEAVTNALRHAGARRIGVTLRREDGYLAIEIADDGGGFDTAAARRRSLAGESGGLLGMEERAELLGGRLSMDSAPGAGTRVRVEFAMHEGGYA